MKIYVSCIYSKNYKFMTNSSIENILINLKKSLNKKFIINSINEKNLFENINFFLKSKIIYLHGCWSFIYLLFFFVGKILGKKIFFSPHGMLDPESLKFKILKKKIAWIIYQKLILKNSDMIIVNSKFEKINLNLLGSFINIYVIPHGISDINFKKKINNLNSSLFKIIFFSRIHPIKGLAELVNFWINSKFLLNSSKYQLDVYGYAEDKDYLNRVIDIVYKNKVNNINIFSDNLFYNKKIISNYDLLIIPSISENFNLVVLEALYLKVPVVTSVNMPWKFLEKLDLGLTIDFSDYFQSKKLLLFIQKLKNKKYKKNFIKNSIKLIREKYNWLKISKKYSSLFEKFI